MSPSTAPTRPSFLTPTERDVAALIQMRGYPCVSLLVPTRPGPRISTTDASRLGTLLARAESLLAEHGVTRAGRLMGALRDVAHEDLPVIGSLFHPFLGGLITAEHCHARNKMRMLWDAGYDQIAIAYSDSSADLPLLHAARKPVVVNPKRGRVAMFRRVLPPGTPILNWGCPDRAGDPVPA